MKRNSLVGVGLIAMLIVMSVWAGPDSRTFAKPKEEAVTTMAKKVTSEIEYAMWKQASTELYDDSLDELIEEEEEVEVEIEEEIEEATEEYYEEPYEEYFEEEYEEEYEEECEEEYTDEGLTPIGEYRITAYEWTGNPCANGNYPTEGYTIACNDLSLGTQVYIDGVGYRTVEDRGGGGSGWIDLYLGDVDSCYEWGVQYREVWIVG